MYADFIHVFEELEDAEAGRLVKHLLRYVNDQNPEAPDKLTKIAFEPIKQQLKRDLQGWELTKESKSNGGQLGNLKRWNVDLYEKVTAGGMQLTEALRIAKDRTASHTDRTRSHPIASVAVNDNVTVTVNDTVTVTKENIVKSFDFRRSLHDLGVSKEVADGFMQVRKVKKATNTSIAFNRIANEIKKSGLPAEDCIKIAVEKSWKGFEAEWIINSNSQNGKSTANNTAQRPSAAERMEQLKRANSERLAGKTFSEGNSDTEDAGHTDVD